MATKEEEQLELLKQQKAVARKLIKEQTAIADLQVDREQEKQVKSIGDAVIAEKALPRALDVLNKDPNVSQDEKQHVAIKASNPKALLKTAKENNFTEDSSIKETGTLADSFKDALVFFAPQLIGGFIGGQLEGDAGVAAGIEQSGKARDAFLGFQKGQEELALKQTPRKKQPKIDITPDFQTRGSKEPVFSRQNTETGLPEFINDKGEVVASNQVESIRVAGQRESQQSISGRHEENIDLRRNKFRYEQGETVVKRKEKIISNFNNDPIMRGAKESLVAANKAEVILKGDGKLAPSVMGRLLARMAGEVGVMTDADVAAFRGSAQWTDQMERWYVGGTTGKLTTSDKKEMKTMIDGLKKASQDTITGWADTQAQQSSSYSGLRVNDINKMILPKESKNLFKAPSKGKSTQRSGKKLMSDKQRKRLEELRKKHGAQ